MTHKQLTEVHRRYDELMYFVLELRIEVEILIANFTDIVTMTMNDELTRHIRKARNDPFSEIPKVAVNYISRLNTVSVHEFYGVPFRLEVVAR